MTLDEYMKSQDDNAFWRLGSGHHQNLLDEAVERLESIQEAWAGRVRELELSGETIAQLQERVAELEEWIEFTREYRKAPAQSLARRDARVKARLLGELIDEANNRYTESISLRDLIEMEQEVQEEADRLEAEAEGKS